MSGFSKITHRVVALAATTILVDTDHKLFTDASLLKKFGLRRRTPTSSSHHSDEDAPRVQNSAQLSTTGVELSMVENEPPPWFDFENNTVEGWKKNYYVILIGNCKHL